MNGDERSYSTESHACAGQATTSFAQIETGKRSLELLQCLFGEILRSCDDIEHVHITLLTTHVVWITGSAQMGPERAADVTDTTRTSCHIRGQSQEHGMQGFFWVQKPQAASGLKP